MRFLVLVAIVVALATFVTLVFTHSRAVAIAGLALVGGVLLGIAYIHQSRGT